MKKKDLRKNFRQATFSRDKYCCQWCGNGPFLEHPENHLDAHHITDRNEIPNGGYVAENGISLCKYGKDGEESCHLKAEKFHITSGKEWTAGMHPNNLYKIIGSSKEEAVAKSIALTNNENIWKFPFYEVNQPLDWEAMEATYDWLRQMRDVPQDAIWHAEGDVFIHTQMVVSALIKLPEFKVLSEQDKHILVAAALMHDIEKRSTTTTKIMDGKERIVAPRHAKKGEYTARAILYKGLVNQENKPIETPFAIREAIAKLVRQHGAPLWAISQDDPQKFVITRSLELNTKHVAMLAKADVLGRICEDAEDMLLRIDLFKELCLEHDCWGKPKEFKSNYGRFLYLNKPETSPDYEPFDDLKSTVYMLSALPGSGKDTYIKKHLDLPVLSLDNTRRANNISPRDKKKNGWVVQQAKEQAKVYLRSRTDFVFNATNITTDMRQRWISLFTDYKAKVELIYIEVPFHQLQHQNHNRTHKVPLEVIEKMIGKLEIPTFGEAHEVRYVVGE